MRIPYRRPLAMLLAALLVWWLADSVLLRFEFKAQMQVSNNSLARIDSLATALAEHVRVQIEADAIRGATTAGAIERVYMIDTKLDSLLARP